MGSVVRHQRGGAAVTLTKYDRENVGPILTDPRKDWFTAQLLRLIAKADSHHRALLAQSFPEEVWLVENHLGRALTTRLEVAP